MGADEWRARTGRRLADGDADLNKGVKLKLLMQIYSLHQFDVKLKNKILHTKQVNKCWSNTSCTNDYVILHLKLTHVRFGAL
jgi:hypothetical protein